MDFINHGHHGAEAAGGAAEGFQPLPLGTDGVVNHYQTVEPSVLPVGDDVKVVGQGLSPSLLGITDGKGGSVTGEGQIRVFQAVPRGKGSVGFMEDFQIRAHRRKLLGIGF